MLFVLRTIVISALKGTTMKSSRMHKRVSSEPATNGYMPLLQTSVENESKKIRASSDGSNNVLATECVMYTIEKKKKV